MKTLIKLPFCALQSITYTPERRVMIFTSTVAWAGLTQRSLIRRRLPLRLKLLIEPEAAFSFEPVIQVRSLAKS